MQARIRRSNQIISVELMGKIDYESLEGFIDLCRKELTGKSVIFNLEALHFVGSSGVTSFLQLLANLQRVPNANIKYVGMAKEFVKLFQTLDETKSETLALYVSEFEATKSFLNPSPTTEMIEEGDTVIAQHDLQQKNLEG